jgi:hypothetical protein
MTSSGIQIAYLSGVESEGEKGISTFGSADVVDLVKPLAGNREYKGVDILLTSQWSRGVDKYGSEPVSIFFITYTTSKNILKKIQRRCSCTSLH